MFIYWEMIQNKVQEGSFLMEKWIKGPRIVRKILVKRRRSWTIFRSFLSFVSLIYVIIIIFIYYYNKNLFISIYKFLNQSKHLEDENCNLRLNTLNNCNMNTDILFYKLLLTFFKDRIVLKRNQNKLIFIHSSLSPS